MLSIRRAVVAAFAAAVLFAVHADQLDPGIYGVYGEGNHPYNFSASPGSVVLIFSGGFAVGPATPQSSAGFPLVTSLAGTSVRVTVGAVSVDAYVLGTEAMWVRALIPSSTPVGEGRLVVTYNGDHTLPYRIEVVERSVGLYDGGFCAPSSAPKQPSFCVPRGVQNIGASGVVEANTWLTPARPGQLLVLWGTGLGASSGDEAAGPIPGGLPVEPFRVLIGNQAAKILYAGRSGCCAGMDEIIVQVPRAIEGCNVPVWVRYDEQGSTSGELLIAIASGAGGCSDPQGLSEAEVRTLATGKLKTGQIGPGVGSFGIASTSTNFPCGACSANAWGRSYFSVGIPGVQIDAGRALTLNGPAGSVTAPRLPNLYYNVPSDIQVPPGSYTLDNSSGSEAVPAFRAQFSIPEQSVTWSNPEEFTEANLSKGVNIAWSGVAPGDGAIDISAVIGNDGESSGTFFCSEAASKGSFTIPAEVFERLRANSPSDTDIKLGIGYHIRRRLTVPGWDLVEFDISYGVGSSTTSKTISITPRK